MKKLLIYAFQEFYNRILVHFLVLITGVAIAYFVYFKKNGCLPADRWQMFLILIVFLMVINLVVHYRTIKKRTWDNPMFLVEINLFFIILLALACESWIPLPYGFVLLLSVKGAIHDEKKRMAKEKIKQGYHH